jgi:glycosyltransferase involved in cell wall biosynthesis
MFYGQAHELPMKGAELAIILVNGSLAPSIFNLRGPLIRELVSRGHTVYASAPDITAGDAERIASLGAIPTPVPLQRTRQGIAADIRYFLTLRSLMRELSPDRVLNYTVKPNIWGSFAARLVGIPTVSMVTGLGYVFTESTTWKQRLTKVVARVLYGLAIKSNRMVLFQNPDDVQDFAAAIRSLDLRKVKLTNGSGVDLVTFSPVPLPERAVFLMIARFISAKGIREYGAACARLKAAYPDAECLLVGMADSGPDGVPEAEVMALCTGVIEYLGPLFDVRESIARASVLVLPSYREGTPRSTLEAMAMARPVITTDVPGCRETVIDGVNGRLVPVRDVDALAAAMIELARSPQLRQTMGAKSREIAQLRFDVDKVNDAIIAALDLSDQPPPQAA